MNIVSVCLPYILFNQLILYMVGSVCMNIVVFALYFVQLTYLVYGWFCMYEYS